MHGFRKKWWLFQIIRRRYRDVSGAPFPAASLTYSPVSLFVFSFHKSRPRDINCRNLTYISCLHGKLSFHIKCTQRQAASDELENLNLLFLFSAIYNLSPDKTKVSDYLYKFTQILSDYLRISYMTEKDFQR